MLIMAIQNFLSSVWTYLISVIACISLYSALSVKEQNLASYQYSFHVLRLIMCFTNYCLFFLHTSNQYFYLRILFYQVYGTHNCVNLLFSASYPYIYSSAIHRRCIFQISIINPINEIRILGMCRSFWSINYNFRIGN